MKKVLVTLLELYGAPRSTSAPGDLSPSSLRPWLRVINYAPSSPSYNRAVLTDDIVWKILIANLTSSVLRIGFFHQIPSTKGDFQPCLVLRNKCYIGMVTSIFQTEKIKSSFLYQKCDLVGNRIYKNFQTETKASGEVAVLFVMQ